MSANFAAFSSQVLNRSYRHGKSLGVAALQDKKNWIVMSNIIVRERKKLLGNRFCIAK